MLLEPHIQAVFLARNVKGMYERFSNTIYLIRPPLKSNQYQWQNYFVRVIAHELRHRTMHVLQTQLCGRPQLECTPYSYNQPAYQDYHLQIEKDDNKIFAELSYLLLKEKSGTLSPSEYKKLHSLRLVIEPFLLNQKFEAQYYISSRDHFDDFKLSGKFILSLLFDINIELDVHQYEIEIVDETSQENIEFILRITDPIVALLNNLSQHIRYLKLEYGNTYGYHVEREAHLWSDYPLVIYKTFYHDIFNETQNLLMYILEYPRQVQHNMQLMSDTEQNRLRIALHPEKGHQNKLIFDLNLPFATYYTALKYTSRIPRLESEKLFLALIESEKAFLALIAMSHLKYESVVELAQIYFELHDYAKACHYYHKAAKLYPFTDPNSKLSDTDRLFYGRSCMNAGKTKIAMTVYSEITQFWQCQHSRKIALDDLQHLIQSNPQLQM